MEIKNVLLGTISILVMLSTSALGQFQLNQQSTYPERPLSSPSSFPSPSNSPGGFSSNSPPPYSQSTNPGSLTSYNPPSSIPQNNPSSSQPGSFSPFIPQSNAPQNYPSIDPSRGFNSFSPQPNTQPQYPSSQPLGLNPYSPQPTTPQQPSSSFQPASFSPYSSPSNTPQQYPSNTQPLGFSPSSPQLSTPQQYPLTTQPSSFSPFSPLSKTPQQYPSSTQPSSFSPLSSQYPPSTQPASFTPYSPQSSTPQRFPTSTQPLGSSPLSHQLTTPQQYYPSTHPAGFTSYSPLSNSPQHYPSSTQPLGSSTYNPHLSTPQQYPPSTQPSSFRPYSPQSNTPQHYLPSTQPVGFSSYNPQSNSKQPYSSNQPGGFNSYTTHSNSPQYDSSSTQKPSSSNTYNSNSNINQNSSSGSSGGNGTISNSNQPTSTTTHSSSHHGAHKHHPHPSAQSEEDEDPLGDYRIVCLFNNRHYFRGGFTPSEVDPTLCTHLNYEFAILDPKSYEMIVGEPDLDIAQNFYQEAVDLRKRNPKLKVMVSLGGWSDSTKKYSEMAADKEKRNNFVAKAIPFLRDHEFDGLDVAWEYPNCWQGAIGINPQDKDNFIALLTDLNAALKKEGLHLSVSVGAIKREVEAAYDVPAISKLVDYINVMTYDMHGPWEPVTGHHMQFDKKPDDSDPYCNVKAAMENWVQKGADKKKLNMGMAFYAKTFTLADMNNCGMGAPAIGVGNPGPDSGEGGFLLYNEICPMLNAGNWTEASDKQAGFYAYSGDQWACYDNPVMVVKKGKYVVEAGYGGVLLKDLSGDDYKGLCFNMPFPLLKMLNLEIIQKVRKLRRKYRKKVYYR